MTMQIVFPLPVMFVASFPIAHYSADASWLRIFSIGALMVLFMTIFGHKDWDRDQTKLRDKENEETVTL